METKPPAARDATDFAEARAAVKPVGHVGDVAQPKRQLNELAYNGGRSGEIGALRHFPFLASGFPPSCFRPAARGLLWRGCPAIIVGLPL
jgi:hypothetical protein